MLNITSTTLACVRQREEGLFYILEKMKLLKSNWIQVRETTEDFSDDSKNFEVIQ